MINHLKQLFEQKYPYVVFIRMRGIDSPLRVCFEDKQEFHKRQMGSMVLIGHVLELNGHPKEVRINQQHILYIKEG